MITNCFIALSSFIFKAFISVYLLASTLGNKSPNLDCKVVYLEEFFKDSDFFPTVNFFLPV
nr:MAG TPA: hypothetical protein [Bacteriophage sp.]